MTVIQSRFELFQYSMIGIVVYSYVVRFQGFWPFHTSWLFNIREENVDASANYLGWEFFRHGPLSLWPISSIPGLGPIGGSSVAMTDSLPFLAIAFKPFTFWFDTPFQYFGLWIFACFVLQAIFAGKLLSLWISNKLVVLLGVTFFVMSPAFLDRMRFHLPLAAHWLIVASIYFYFTKQRKLIHWLLLGGLTVFVHPYLAPIVGLMFIASELSEIKMNKKSISLAIRNLFLYLVVQIFAAFQSGLLVFGLGSTGKEGLGDFSANVLTLFDPARQSLSPGNRWSNYIQDIPEGSYQYEGFAYLGSGVFAIAFVACLLMVFRSSKITGLVCITVIIVSALLLTYFFSVGHSTGLLLGSLLSLVIGTWKSLLSKKVSIFLFILMSLTLFSFSNRWSAADSTIVFSIPSGLEWALSVFRTTGRFIWLALYSAILFVLVASSRIFKSHFAFVLILVLGNFVGLMESRGGVGIIRSAFKNEVHESTFSDPLWLSIAKEYRHIVIVNPSSNPKLEQTTTDFFEYPVPYLWQDLGRFAAQRKMTINAFYFSRSPDLKYSLESDQIRDVILNGKYNHKTIYVFIDAPMWILAKINHRDQDLIGLLDGLPVLLPDLAGCRSCDLTGFQSKV